MDFPSPLIEGVFLRRYKRFFADVRLAGGAEITAHCPNPGAMLGLQEAGARAWLSHNPGPKRKLAYTLELLRAPGGLVGVNTLLPNRIVAEALAERRIPALSPYARVRREVAYGAASRVDFVLEAEDGRQCYLEIKNVHLSRRDGLAEFPDCVTARGAKHMADLAAMIGPRCRAAVMFLVQREDCNRFAVAADLDPAYARAFEAARAAGVEPLVHACRITPEAITLGPSLPLVP